MINSSLFIRSLSSTDILRIYALWQNCKYAQKTQLFLDLKKYRYVGEIAGFERAPQLPIHRSESNKCFRLFLEVPT